MSVKPISHHITLIDAPFHGAKGILGSYLIKADKTAIIDPGPTAVIPQINNALNTLNTTQLNYIIPTHIHLDHAGGTWKLMETYPMSTLIVHPRGRQHIINPIKLEEGARALFGDHVTSYGQIKGTPSTRTYESSDNQEITLGDVTLKIVWTPGHSTHHQCIYIPEDQTLIAGDAAGYFSEGIIMPTTPPPFNPVKAIESLNILIELSPETICYGHFGCSGDAIEKLIAHRKQIKTWLYVIEDYLDKGKDLNLIYEAIRAADPYAMKSGKFNPKKGERLPRVNLQGFIKYIEWKKKRK
jgi:glyoxylase-like metal-dependent hydrolase (beta-lactamase superfamily II)